MRLWNVQVEHTLKILSGRNELSSLVRHDYHRAVADQITRHIIISLPQQQQVFSNFTHCGVIPPLQEVTTLPTQNWDQRFRVVKPFAKLTSTGISLSGIRRGGPLHCHKGPA